MRSLISPLLTVRHVVFVVDIEVSVDSLISVWVVGNISEEVKELSHVRITLISNQISHLNHNLNQIDMTKQSITVVLKLDRLEVNRLKLG